MKPLKFAVVGLCLPVLACYEEPVRDHLHIVFSPGPAIVITAVRDIAPPAAAGENSAVEERTDEARMDLATGLDRWSRSFSDISAIADRSTIERHDGQPRRGIHSALLDSFRPVERLLGNEGLDAFFDESGGVRELQLRPLGVGQASRQQRAQLEDALDDWSHEVAVYIEATAALYAHLDRAPDRAVLCFGYIFDEDQESLSPLGKAEGELVAAVIDALERVAAVLRIDKGQAYSLNELSRLVCDTFQGRLTVTVDGPVVETEGFVDHETFVERPPVDLWHALETMVGQWLVPDLVTAMARPGPNEIQPDPDPVDFASLPRRWAPAPDPATVEAELRSRLQPEPVYLVRWQTRPAPEDEDEIYSLALQQLATAEQDLPD